MKKIYTLRGRKDENEPSEPKIGIWGPKLVWSYDIFTRVGFFYNFVEIDLYLLTYVALQPVFG
jgi:hypothetical protein